MFWMTALALFIVATGVIPATGDPVPPRATAAIEVTVARADTLWSIASEHRLPGLSTAQMVRVIQDANALPGGVLEAGAVLHVPTEATPGTAYAQVNVSPAVH